MKKTHKKGFTVIELVIVIAVIAILAAVLIPTYASLIQKSKLSADEVAVNDMNTILTEEELINGKPEDYGKMRDLLSKNGFREGALTPVASNHKFYWRDDTNRVMLVDVSNADDFKAVYPEDAVFVVDKCHALDGLPVAGMESLATSNPNGLNITLGDGGSNVTLDTGLTFKNAAEYSNAPNFQEYADWNCDFTIEFSKGFNSGLTFDNPTDNLGSGKVGFALVGQYGTYPWIPLAVLEAEENKPIRIMQELLGPQLNFGDSPWTYRMIGLLDEFNCGIKAVYGDGFNLYDASYDNFDYNNQNFDSDGTDKALLDGMVVTIKLCMYETDSAGHETGKTHVIKTYSYTYNV